jgi:hypothetical protein
VTAHPGPTTEPLQLKSVIKLALEAAHAEKIHDEPTLRSARFVWKLGEGLKSQFCREAHSTLLTQRVLDGNGREDGRKKGTRIRKEPGEWLLDIAIVQKTEIEDHGSKSVSNINTRMIWAVESESSTSLKDFADDFGKLLCVKADEYLYLNGLDQQPGKNQELFISRRIETIERGLNKKLREIRNQPANFYMAFWPSPSNGKRGWDDGTPIDKLKAEVRLFVLREADSDNVEFVEVGDRDFNGAFQFRR